MAAALGTKSLRAGLLAWQCDQQLSEIKMKRPTQKKCDKALPGCRHGANGPGDWHVALDELQGIRMDAYIACGGEAAQADGEE